MSRERIEFSHQTKTVYVGGLEDGIDDPELQTYFSESSASSRAPSGSPTRTGPRRSSGSWTSTTTTQWTWHGDGESYSTPSLTKVSGEKNNYKIFVKGGPNIASKNVKIPRGMLEYVAGKARG